MARSYVIFNPQTESYDGWVAVAKDPPADRAGIGTTPHEALDSLLDYLDTKVSDATTTQ